jgi:hypothetical protein
MKQPQSTQTQHQPVIHGTTTSPQHQHHKQTTQEALDLSSLKTATYSKKSNLPSFESHNAQTRQRES